MNADKIKQHIEDLIQQSPLADFSNEAKARFQSQLNQFFANANLVTREEFDAQTNVLLRLQDKLAQLEKQLKEIEEKEGSVS